MVRTLIINFLLLTFSVNSWCQKQNRVYEIFAGAGLLTNHGLNYQEGVEKKLGFIFGGGVTHNFSESFCFKVRGAAEAKGFRARETYLLGTIDHQTHHVSNQLVTDDLDKAVNFLTITVLPTMRFGRQRNFSIGLGVFYGFLKNVRQKFSRMSQNGPVINATSSDKYGATDDIGLVFNAAYRFVFFKSTFEVQLNHSYGLNQCYGEFYLSPIDYQIKSGLSSIMLSYVIPGFR